MSRPQITERLSSRSFSVNSIGRSGAPVQQKKTSPWKYSLTLSTKHHDILRESPEALDNSTLETTSTESTTVVTLTSGEEPHQHPSFFLHERYSSASCSTTSTNRTRKRQSQRKAEWSFNNHCTVIMVMISSAGNHTRRLVSFALASSANIPPALFRGASFLHSCTLSLKTMIKAFECRQISESLKSRNQSCQNLDSLQDITRKRCKRNHSKNKRQKKIASLNSTDISC